MSFYLFLYMVSKTELEIAAVLRDWFCDLRLSMKHGLHRRLENRLATVRYASRTTTRSLDAFQAQYGLAAVRLICTFVA
jgi:hypothetical protein